MFFYEYNVGAFVALDGGGNVPFSATISSKEKINRNNLPYLQSVLKESILKEHGLKVDKDFIILAFCELQVPFWKRVVRIFLK